MADGFGLTSAPIEAAYLVGENSALHRQFVGNGNLKRIALHLIGDRAEEGKTGLAVVDGGRDHQCRTTTGLFVPCLRIQAQPDQVATVRHIALSQITCVPAFRHSTVIGAWVKCGVTTDTMSMSALASMSVTLS